MNIDIKFVELIGVFLNYLRFVNYNVFLKREAGARKKYLQIPKEWIIYQILAYLTVHLILWKEKRL